LLAGYLREIYHRDPPEVSEYHGEWGSLAVSQNIYKEFQPYETEAQLFVIIGGPVLNFCSNRFLTGDDPLGGTLPVFERFQNGDIRWDEDLSGPFAILIVDKLEKTIQCITDLMLFIPVYEFVSDRFTALGTHVDALAKTAGRQSEIDKVSLVDFVLHKLITYPYTAYTGIWQCCPAANHTYYPFSGPSSKPEPKRYWTPVEQNSFDTIDEAAEELRKAVTEEIERVTESMVHVAQFISGGEDSRTIAGLMPDHLKKDGFIFLDNMNREGRIARKVSGVYGLNFTVKLREPTHYLKILPEASDMIGSGRQFTHAHTLGFHKECKLTEYDAVFGGFLANSLLKADEARKTDKRKRYPFLPDKLVEGEEHSRPVENKLFTSPVLREIDKRRHSFIKMLREYRKDSLHEWFQFWPRSMGYACPNVDVNRRLFRSYEPFLCNKVIKISASVPTTWKLNRRIYAKAFRESHKPAKWIPHANGYLPFFPWWFNVPLLFFFWFRKKIKNRLGLSGKVHDGPWFDWNALVKTDEWKTLVKECEKDFIKDFFEGHLSEKRSDRLSNELKHSRIINLIQIRYQFYKKKQ